MKRILFTLMVVFSTSCTTYDQNISIKDVGQSQTIILKNDSDKNVHSIAIKVSGNINGDAKIHLILNDEQYKTESIGGNVDFKWGGDWYSNDAVIIYKTTNVTKGGLSIDYAFITM